MAAEGITFETGVDVGREISAFDLMYRSDAVVLAVGATRPRDLPVPGRDLEGVHFAHGVSQGKHEELSRLTPRRPPLYQRQRQKRDRHRWW